MNQIKVELQNVYGDDKDVGNSAWTSSLDIQKKKTKSKADLKKLISFLADNKHSTPFESIIFKFWIKCPVQTDRQIMTHRLQSSSGMSGRYRTMPDEFLEVPCDIEYILMKSPNMSKNYLRDEYTKQCKKSNQIYNFMLQEMKLAQEKKLITNDQYKRAREFFRGVLPQNNMTERVTIMNLRSWANFYRLRSSKHAQPEIQYIANEMLKLIKKSGKCKETIKALEKNNWNI